MKKINYHIEDEEQEEKVYIAAFEIYEDILKLTENIPDKRTKEFKVWNNKYKELALKYNEFVKFKCLNVNYYA